MTANATQPAADKTAPAPTKQLSAIGQSIVTRKAEIGALQQEFARSLPPSIPADKFVRTVQTAIQMNPDIAVCTKESVVNACMKAASDGLILDGREAALTVYNVKKKDRAGNETWVKEAQYMPMVTGIIKRVRNSGEVSRFNAFVVHKNDTFKVSYGLEMALEHVPNFENPGAPIGAYAICRFKDGLDDFEFMTTQQIEAIQARSKSPDKGPWKTDKEEMWKKTVMRRLSKRLPMDSDIRNVVQRVDDLFAPDEPDAGVIDGTTGEIIDEKPARKPREKKAGGAAAKMAQATPPAGQAAAGEPSDDMAEPPFVRNAQKAANAPAAQGGQPASYNQPVQQPVAEAEYEEVDEGDDHQDEEEGDVI